MTFEVVSRDKWGNAVVRCPICGGGFKQDGVRKHIIQMHKEQKLKKEV